MSRRKYTLRWSCAEEGCREFDFSEVSYKADYIDAQRRQRANPWKCLRHDHPEAVLSPTNRERTFVITSGKSERHPHLDNLFWDRPFTTGFTSGPGFKAYADDFPEGTKIIVTTRVELPEERAQ